MPDVAADASPGTDMAVAFYEDRRQITGFANGTQHVTAVPELAAALAQRQTVFADFGGTVEFTSCEQDGVLLIASAVVAGVAVARTGSLPRAAGIGFAISVLLFAIGAIPDNFLQTIAGVLMIASTVWIAAAPGHRGRTSPDGQRRCRSPSRKPSRGLAKRAGARAVTRHASHSGQPGNPTGGPMRIARMGPPV